jgi:hypothetical protein
VSAALAEVVTKGTSTALIANAMAIFQNFDMDSPKFSSVRPISTKRFQLTFAYRSPP